MVDLGGGGPEKRIDAKRRSSGGAPMAVGGRAVDSRRGRLVEVRNTVGEALAEGNGRTTAEDGRGGESRSSARARAEGMSES